MSLQAGSFRMFILAAFCLVSYAIPAFPDAVLSLDGSWLLATDPGNTGQAGQWWTAPRLEAKETNVPWIIQDAFPGYHGVVWYYKNFDAPANPQPNGRTLLRFWQVDYKADVWLNDVAVGSHEGGESVFVLDVTNAVKPGVENRLAVRVLNPTQQPIDGIVLAETAHRNKALPYSSGNAWDQGGIWDSVELLNVPQVWIEDLYTRPDWKTGELRIQATLRNGGAASLPARVAFSVAPATSGETLETTELASDAAPGDTLVEGVLHVTAPHLWNLNDPFLYRVTANAVTGTAPRQDVHELSVRCGFRDFRLENGYFRLNGKRIYVRCSHTGNCCPIGLEMPPDLDFLRRDLINQKMMGYNAMRFISGVPKRYQLDLADDIGLMMYTEAYAGWCLADSPNMERRYDESIFGMIRRDRNHPSITMWGLLNETPDGAVFRHAIKLLPEVRKLDDTRVVLLNSGNVQMQTGGVAGIRVWHPSDRPDPCVTFNGTDHDIRALGITWAPGQLAFHPGRSGEYAVVRWTAPAEDTVDLAAAFKTIAEHATTSVHVFHNGKPLFERLIDLEGNGPECEYAAPVSVHVGDTLDFVCGWGNNDYGADTTALAVTLTSASGKVWDAAKEFSIEHNPNGAWSYGMLPPAAAPAIAGFAAFPFGKSEENVGCISNPGSTVWEDLMSDQHPYRRVPHIAPVIQELRTLGGGKPVFISECGIGSAMNLPRTVRLFEQAGKTEVEDAKLYRSWYDQYRTDWDRYHLADIFGRPEDFFTQSMSRMAGQRLLSVNAVRANPNCIGHSLTGTVDQGMTGEGVWTTFRELKPGATDALFDAWAPLRWCLFAEPLNIYRNTPVKLDAVLANEDVLAPGDYPVLLQVIGPDQTRVFEKTITVTIADPKSAPEPPLVLPIFSEDVVIDGPPGTYRFLATFEKGAAARGEEIQFFVDAAPADMPGVDGDIALLGDDAGLAQWLDTRGIHHHPYAPGSQSSRDVILASGKPAGDTGVVFTDLAQRIARGSSVIFLTTDTYAKDKESTGWLPLKTKGNVSGLARWLYHSDEWCKRHPIFDGMPAGGLMDYAYYRELIPDVGFMGIEMPGDPVAGGINASQGYQSALLVGVYQLGAGEFILNSLNIRANLGQTPQAERLLRNMLRFAGRNVAAPLAELPADFEDTLKTFGY